MELLSGILVNNGMKNLKKYNVSQIYRGGIPGSSHRIRHITELFKAVAKETVYLCNYRSRHIALKNKTKIKSYVKSLCQLSTYYSEALSLYTCSTKYPFVYKDLCKKCFNKLPKDIQDRIKFNYIVSKLKNED